jgi:hypothetical protein
MDYLVVEVLQVVAQELMVRLAVTVAMVFLVVAGVFLLAQVLEQIQAVMVEADLLAVVVARLL